MQDPLTDKQIRDAATRRLQAWEDGPVKGQENGGYLGGRPALPSLFSSYIGLVKLRRIGLGLILIMTIIVTVQKWMPIEHRFATTSQVGEVRALSALVLKNVPE